LQHGDALLLKSEELELFRFQGEDVCRSEGGVDLGDVGPGLAAILKLAEGEEVVFALARFRRQLSVAMRWGSWVSMAPSGARSWIGALENCS